MASRGKEVKGKSTLVDLSSELIQQREKYVNGTHFPIKEPRETAQQNSRCSGNIAAIDFGTTSCSLAYSVAGDTRIRFLRLDEANDRVPTAILMDANGRVVDFGSNARRRFAQLPKERKQHHHYFSEIKMTLQHDKVSVLTLLLRPCNVKLYSVYACMSNFKKDSIYSDGCYCS